MHYHILILVTVLTRVLVAMETTQSPLSNKKLTHQRKQAAASVNDVLLLVGELRKEKYPLHQAVKSENMSLIKELLSKDEDYLYRYDSDNLTPTELAAKLCKRKAFDYFIERAKVPVNYRNLKTRKTLLHWAVLACAKDIVEDIYAYAKRDNIFIDLFLKDNKGRSVWTCLDQAKQLMSTHGEYKNIVVIEEILDNQSSNNNNAQTKRVMPRSVSLLKVKPKQGWVD